MDIGRGVWLHLPYGDKSIYEVTDEDEAMCNAAEYAARTLRVWSKSVEHRTMNDNKFMSWVIKDEKSPA